VEEVVYVEAGHPPEQKQSVFAVTPVILPFGINQPYQPFQPAAESGAQYARRPPGLSRKTRSYGLISIPAPRWPESWARNCWFTNCVDEHSAYKGFDPETVKAIEKELLAKTDITFVTAQGLYQDKAPLCREIQSFPQ
jgi:hypothetical protein